MRSKNVVILAMSKSSSSRLRRCENEAANYPLLFVSLNSYFATKRIENGAIETKAVVQSDIRSIRGI